MKQRTKEKKRRKKNRKRTRVKEREQKVLRKKQEDKDLFDLKDVVRINILYINAVNIVERFIYKSVYT